MITYNLTVKLEKQDITNYLYYALFDEPCKMAKLYHHNYITIRIYSDNETIDDIIIDAITEAIYYYFKAEFVQKNLVSINDDIGIFGVAGALVAINKEEDLVKLKKIINRGHYINAEAIYNFACEDILEEWKSLVTIANKLLITCANKKDIEELTSYLLSFEEEGVKNVEIANFLDTNKVKILDKVCHIPQIFINPESNLLCFTIYNKPQSITIERKDKVDKRLLEAIVGLGK